MRRSYSILLLFLILLNSVGYYQVLMLIENNQFNRFSNKIEGNEDDISGNLLLRIPLAVPYGQDDNEYRKAKGEIIIDGELYHFVKRKMYHDTLYVICLRDLKTTEAREAISDYSKSFTDALPNSGAAKAKIDLTLSLLYVLSENITTHASDGWVLSFANSLATDFYQFTSIDTIFHPPWLLT